MKCEQYWPERVGEAITVDGGRLIVHLNEVVPFADYELRKLTVYCVSHKTSQNNLYSSHTILVTLLLSVVKDNW